MKRALLLMLVLSLALGVTAVAEDDTKMLSSFGIKGGLNIANLSGDIEDNKALMAFGGGVFGQLTVSPTLIIQPEVLYMQKGTEEDVDGGEKLKLNYIEVPILVKYVFPTEGSFEPCVYAGPVISFLMSAKIGDEDIKDFVKSTDFGVAFGAGAEFAVGEGGGKFHFDGRYTLGLTNASDDDSDDDVKNGVISVFVGYGFPLGK